MAEFSISKAMDFKHHKHHLFFPNLEPMEPPPLSPSPVINSFSRGPMHSTYSELRDSKIRMKMGRMDSSSSTPFPMQLKRTSFSSSVDRLNTLRKENRKPLPTIALNFDSQLTPLSPMARKLEVRKVCSVTVSRMEEKKGGAGELFPMRRSFSGFSGVKEISKGPSIGVEGKRGGSKMVASRRSITGF